MKYALLLMLALLVGCVLPPTPMTDEQVAAAVTRCESLGLVAESYRRMFGGDPSVVKVVCVPPIRAKCGEGK